MCRRILLIAVAASFLMAGCKTSSTSVAPPLAPGFVNSADQEMFSTLKAAHDFYQVLYRDSQPGLNGEAPKWTPSPQEKQSLNVFAVTLNAAEAEYTAFKTGLATEAQAQEQVNKVIAAQTQLQSIVPTKISYPDPAQTRS